MGQGYLATFQVKIFILTQSQTYFREVQVQIPINKHCYDTFLMTKLKFHTENILKQKVLR